MHIHYSVGMEYTMSCHIAGAVKRWRMIKSGILSDSTNHMQNLIFVY